MYCYFFVLLLVCMSDSAGCYHSSQKRWTGLRNRFKVSYYCLTCVLSLQHDREEAEAWSSGSSRGKKALELGTEFLCHVPAQLSGRRLIPSCSQHATNDQSITTTARRTRTKRCEPSMQPWQECKSFTRPNLPLQTCTTWLKQFGYK